MNWYEAMSAMTKERATRAMQRSDLDTICEDWIKQKLDEHDALTAELAATKAALEQAQQALRESEANNAKLRQHIEQRANGADPLTQQLRAEKWQAVEQLKEAQKTIERQTKALVAVYELCPIGHLSDNKGTWALVRNALGGDHA